MDKLIEPGKWDRGCLQSEKREYMCVWMICVCINMGVSVHARECVRALYIDGWCTGLEGKRSRLLSLRICQSSAERNQKESKSQHCASVCVRTHVCVCIKCIQPLGYSQKQVRREMCEKGNGCGATWSHTALQWFSVASPKQTCCETLNVETDFVD